MVALVSGDAAVRHRRLLLALAAIGVLAAGLRLLGITFGLPAVYNPDEIAIMSRALAFAKGDLNPHNFLYPTFYFYVLFAWVGASFVRHAGCWGSCRRWRRSRRSSSPIRPASISPAASSA